MNRAEILIEDTSNGAAVKFLFPGGYDKNSNSHQLAHIIQRELDAMAERDELTRLPDTDENQLPQAA